MLRFSTYSCNSKIVLWFYYCIYIFSKSYIYATQSPYHGESYSELNLHQYPLQAWTVAGQCMERATIKSVIGGGGQDRTGKGGREMEVICTYGSGVMSSPLSVTRGVFIGINNETCTTLPSSLTIMNS